MSACGEDPDKISGVALPITRAIDVNVSSDYQVYTEKTLSQRAVSFELFKEVSTVETLSGSQLNSLHTMLESYLQNYTLKNEYMHKYQYLLGEFDNYSNKDRLKLIMISLSAMLVTYDDSKLRTILNYADSAYRVPEDTADSYKGIKSA